MLPTPIKIRLILQVTRALSVRTPPTLLGLDRETFRDHGRVKIPASSLRGVFRTASCYAAISLGLTCCATRNPELMDMVHRRLEEEGRPLVEVGGRRVCHVCSLYGFPGHRGILVFEDAEPLPGAVTTSIYPGIEIDDYTGTVARGKLYFIEAVNPGSLFHTTITLEGQPPTMGEGEEGRCWPLKLLLTALNYVEAVGLGNGAARPYIHSLTTSRGTAEVTAYTAEEAATLTGCPSLKPLFSRHWITGRLTLSQEPAANA